MTTNDNNNEQPWQLTTMTTNGNYNKRQQQWMTTTTNDNDNEQTNKNKMNELTNEWTNKQTNKQMITTTNERTNERTNNNNNEQMKRQYNERNDSITFPATFTSFTTFHKTQSLSYHCHYYESSVIHGLLIYLLARLPHDISSYSLLSSSGFRHGYPHLGHDRPRQKTWKQPVAVLSQHGHWSLSWLHTSTSLPPVLIPLSHSRYNHRTCKGP